MTTAFTKRTGIVLALLASVAVVLVVGSFVLSRVLGLRQPKQSLSVTVVVSGLEAAEVERSAVIPLERALSGVAGLQSLRSEIRDGVGVTACEFEGDEVAFRIAVMEALKTLRSQLPVSAEAPMLSTLSDDTVEERYLIVAETMDASTLSRWVKLELVRALEVQNGVRRVEVCGGVDAQRVVTLDPRKLRAYGIGLADAVHALERSDEDDEPNIGPVQLRDVARVEHTGIPDACRAWLDGAPVQVVTVTRVGAGETKLPVPPAAVSMKRVEEDVEGEYRLTSSDQRVTSKGLSLQHGRELISFAPAPELAVVKKPHGVVVRALGGDRTALRTAASSLRGALGDAAWRGELVPGDDVPMRRVEIERRKPEVASVMRLSLEGARGFFGTTVKIEGGLEGATLDDGTPLSELITVSERLGPELLLRLDHVPVIEFDVGASESEVQRAIADVVLPHDVNVTVTQR